MRKRTLSIILTSKDRYELLLYAVKSVYAQTFKDWELIIVDDCSTDSRIKKYLDKLSKDKFVEVINAKPVSEEFRKQHKMISVRINSAIGLCKGQFISYLCDDDYYLADRCQKMIDVFKADKEISMVVNMAKWVTWDGRFIAQDKFKYAYPKPFKVGHANLLQAIKPSNFIVHDCVMHREIRKCCRWPTDSEERTPVDWRFWLKLNDGENFKIHKMSEIGAVAYFPGTWKTKTVSEALLMRQDISEVQMVNRNRLRAKREAEENRAIVVDDDMVRMVVNTSGTNVQITTNNQPIKVPPGGEIEEKYVKIANGGIMPGFSYKSRAVPKPVKRVLAEKPKPLEYGFDIIKEPEEQEEEEEKAEFTCSDCGKEISKRSKTGLCRDCYNESRRKD